jgi:hypothetical protein
MPSTREGSPTAPTSRNGLNSRSDSDSASDHLGYALPNGIISSTNSVASVAVTSASPSIKGGLESSPVRGHQQYSQDDISDCLPLTPRRARDQAIKHALERLEFDLEAHYQVQKNARLTKFLHLTAGGSDLQKAGHRQKEAIERTKFVVYKNSQLSKLLKEVSGGGFGGANDQPVTGPPSYVTASSSVAATPPSRFASVRAIASLPLVPQHKKTESDPFKVAQDFPPPPPRGSRGRTNAGLGGSEVTSTSLVMSSSNSAANDGASSNVNDSTSSIAITNSSAMPVATAAEPTFSRDQIVAALSAIWDKHEAATGEIAQLRGEVAELKNVVRVLTGGSDLTELATRVGLLEAKCQTMVNGRPLESDTAFIVNLEIEVKLLRQEIEALKNDTVSRRTFQAGNELTTMTFTNKCALIEKYLGIDITTTGPKPHDVLEGLHSRLWHLEECLNADDLNSRAHQPYRPLNDFMKTTLGRNNAVVNYSATPGYGMGNGFNGGMLPHGGPVSSVGNLNSAFNGLSLGNHGQFGMHPVASQGDLASQTTSIPDHLADMKYDRNDIRFRGNSTSVVESQSRAHDHHDSIDEEDEVLPRRISSAALLPGGLVCPDNSKRAKDLKSPPRRARNGSSARNSFSVTSPRKSFGHSRNNSTATMKEAQQAIAGASAIAPPTPAPAPKKTNDKAYNSWLHQRPGQFLGGKLAGLGQKE